jgi:hypothetical protein
MNSNILAAALAAGLGSTGVAGAADVDDELAAIKARLSALERQVADQSRVIREKDRKIQELVANPTVPEQPDGEGWSDRIQIGGAIEVEAGYHSPYTGKDTSDLVVSTIELGVDAQLNDWVAGKVTLLYEEDETPLEVDVGILTIAPPDGPWFINAGRQYVPFGTYETYLVSDPLTLELGETRETAVLFGLASTGFVGAFYVFNGDSEKSGDNIDHYGATAGYTHLDDDSAFAMHVGYINHIGDSDTLQDTIGGNVNDYVGGVAIDARLSNGPIEVIADYVAATGRFDATELAFNGNGAAPKAWHLEVAYTFALASWPTTVAFGYQASDEALALDLPETRIATALSVEVADNTTLSFEWAHDKDYGTGDGGTGKTSETATAQLAVEF